MSKAVLVTGGAGFIGSHLVDALISSGHRVTIMDDLSTGDSINLNPAADFHQLDVGSSAAIDLVRELRPDAVFHLAAQTSVPVSVREPIRDAETNILASLKLMQVAADSGVKNFIFAGTGGALSSEAVRLPTDELNAAAPSSPYAIAKVASEHYGAFFRKTSGLNFTSFRFANVYGPRQNPHGEAGVIAVFTKRMLAGEPVAINGSGLQTRDYVYVDDVARALLSGLEKTDAEGPFHVGTSIETTVKDLFARLAGLTGYALAPRQGPSDIGAPQRSALDYGKIKRVMGWTPQVTLDEGLKRTVEWFRYAADRKR